MTDIDTPLTGAALREIAISLNGREHGAVTNMAKLCGTSRETMTRAMAADTVDPVLSRLARLLAGGQRQAYFIDAYGVSGGPQYFALSSVKFPNLNAAMDFLQANIVRNKRGGGLTATTRFAQDSSLGPIIGIGIDAERPAEDLEWIADGIVSVHVGTEPHPAFSQGRSPMTPDEALRVLPDLQPIPSNDAAEEMMRAASAEASQPVTPERRRDLDAVWCYGMNTLQTFDKARAERAGGLYRRPVADILNR